MIFDILETAENLSYIIVFLSMFIILGFLLYRSIKEFRITREINFTRLLFFMVILSNGLEALFQVFIFNNIIPSVTLGADITITEIFRSSTVTFALVFVFYTRKIDLWLLFAPTLIVGNYIVRLTTGNDVLGIYYYAFGFALGIIQLYYIGLKFKDNNSLGMSIMFSLIYIASNLFTHGDVAGLIVTSLNIIAALIGLLFISGVIKVYKNAENEEFEEQEEIING